MAELDLTTALWSKPHLMLFYMQEDHKGKKDRVDHGHTWYPLAEVLYFQTLVQGVILGKFAWV